MLFRLLLVALALAGSASGAMQCKQNVEVSIATGFCQGQTIKGSFCVDSASPTGMPNAFKAMVESFSKTTVCPPAKQVITTSQDQIVNDFCAQSGATTNLCYTLANDICTRVGGTIRDDACSVKRYCKNPFMAFSQQCTTDAQCAAVTVAPSPIQPVGTATPVVFLTNAFLNSATTWKNQPVCCDSLKANINQLCDGVTDAEKKGAAFTKDGGVCADTECFQFSSAASLSSSLLVSLLSAAVAVYSQF